MILPTNDDCVKIIKELENEPTLTQWESDFLESNVGRARFSDAQKEVFAALLEKYEI